MRDLMAPGDRKKKWGIGFAAHIERQPELFAIAMPETSTPAFVDVGGILYSKKQIKTISYEASEQETRPGM